MVSRRLVFVLATLLLVGCQITTVLDSDDVVGDDLWGVDDVERLPDGGFVAVSCSFDADWFGPGIIVARPGQAPYRFGRCFGRLNVAVTASGDIVVAKNQDTRGANPEAFYGVEVLDGDSGALLETVYERVFPQGWAGTWLGSPVVAPDGTIYIGFRDQTTGTWSIHRITGPTSTALVAGTQHLGASDFVVDADGTIIGVPAGAAAGSSRNQVIEVSPTGTRTVLAGTGQPGFSGDWGPAIVARLNFPGGVTRSGEGSVLVTDIGNGRVRRIESSGRIHTAAGGGTAEGDGGLAGEARIDFPADVAASGGMCFWIADLSTDPGRVRHVGLPGLCP